MCFVFGTNENRNGWFDHKIFIKSTNSRIITALIKLVCGCMFMYGYSIGFL